MPSKVRSFIESARTVSTVVNKITPTNEVNADLLDGKDSSYFAPVASPTFTGTGITLPVLPSDPANPVAGQMYYNSTDKAVKNYDGLAWSFMTNKFSASGGTVTEVNGYKYHTFTSSGTFTAYSSGTVEYLIVAGGGGGARYCGGGAGGLLQGTSTLISGLFTVIVGAGGPTGPNSGNADGTKGGSSVFGVTTIGGGAGRQHQAGYSSSVMDGGSGAGGDSNPGTQGGVGTTGQGNNGGSGTNNGAIYVGGGGGGAVTAGASGNPASGAGGSGGDGLNWKSLGTYYAGGGGGSYFNPGGGGGSSSGGSGIGGNGASNLYIGSTGSTSGTTNRGGGGGGGGTGNGGSGIVIIRYPV